MTKLTFKDVERVVEGKASVHAIRQWSVRKKIPLSWQIFIIKNMPIGLVTFDDFDKIFKKEHAE